jgi:hypothetical protein
MSQTPPPVPISPLSYSMEPAPRRTSKSAVTSFVLGVILCIPAITAIPAIIFGMVGFRQTRDPMMRGRNMALIGLACGVLNLFGWTLIVLYGLHIYGDSHATRRAANQWFNDMATSKIADAQALTATTFPRLQLPTLEFTLPLYGPLTNLTWNSMTFEQVNAVDTCTLSGTATFTNPPANHTYQLTLEKESGVWKISQCQVSP